MKNENDLLNLAMNGDKFIQPVWGGPCKDWLRVMPRKPLSRMGQTEKLTWIGTHGAHYDNYTPYVAHNIKVQNFNFNRDNFFEYTNANENWWDDLNMGDEIENMRAHFDIHLDIAIFGRSGGWAGLVESDRPFLRHQGSYRTRPFPALKSKEDLHDGLFYWPGQTALTSYALALMWFDVTVNALIDNAISQFNDMVITKRERTRTIKQKGELLTVKSKSDKSHKQTLWAR